MKGNLLLVGKNSYIGRYLTDYVTASGMKIVSVSSRDCDFLEHNEVERFFGNLGDQPYSVVFLAVINKFVSNSFQSFVDNIKIVRNFVEGQKLANVSSIIYFSSVDVYGNKPLLPVTEQSMINPVCWYGLAKYVCEWMLTSSGEVNCPVTILRLPGVYGRSQNGNSVIGRMISSIRNEKRVVIKGSGRVLRDYVYIDDLCRLLQLLIPLRYHGVVNTATGESRSILEMAGLIGNVIQMDFEIVHDAADEARDFDLVFDIHRLADLVPSFRFCDMAVGIRSYV